MLLTSGGNVKNVFWPVESPQFIYFFIFKRFIATFFAWKRNRIELKLHKKNKIASKRLIYWSKISQRIILCIAVEEPKCASSNDYNYTLFVKINQLKFSLHKWKRLYNWHVSFFCKNFSEFSKRIYKQKMCFGNFCIGNLYVFSYI